MTNRKPKYRTGNETQANQRPRTTIHYKQVNRELQEPKYQETAIQ